MKIDPKDPATWPEDIKIIFAWCKPVDDEQFHLCEVRTTKNEDGEMIPLCRLPFTRKLSDGRPYTFISNERYDQKIAILDYAYPCDRDGWIRVEDGLPEYGTPILFSNNKTGACGYAVYDGRIEFTNWMPAPTQPKR